MKTPRIAFATAALISSALLTACGGGGGSEKASADMSGAQSNADSGVNVMSGVQSNADSGVYVGLVGFNNQVKTTNGLTRLADQKCTSYMESYGRCSSIPSALSDFIDEMTPQNNTALYQAVDKSVSMLEAASLPADTDRVYVVTFTDGLDTMGGPGGETSSEYGAQIQKHLQQAKVNIGTKTVPVVSYAIGVKGSDVGDNVAVFNEALQGLASPSDPSHAILLNYDALSQTLTQIASDLYTSSTSYSISLSLNPGYLEDGAKVVWTFDGRSIIEDAYVPTSSHISAVVKRTGTNVTLTQIEASSDVALTNVPAELSGSRDQYGRWVFKFEPKSLAFYRDTLQLFNKVPSKQLWIKDSEITKASEVKNQVVQKSIAVVLAIDNSSSMTTADLHNAQEASRIFIKTLYHKYFNN